jgi:peptide/nickel transport system substrate-binding protein
LKSLDVRIYSDAYLNNAQLFEFNMENPILSKVEVRHALAHAFDRKFIMESIFYGYAFPAGSTFPAALAAYDDEAPFSYPFNLDTANQLLDAAGFKRDGSGARFSLRLTFIPGDTFKRTAEYVRANFAKLGVKVTILDGDLATFIRRVYYERGFDINLNGISRLFDPTAGVQRLYWSDGIRNPVPYLNAAHYDNPKVDELFRRAAAEVDEAERAQEFKQIQAIVGAELPVFATVALPTVVVANTRVHGLFNSIDMTSGDFSQTWLER